MEKRVGRFEASIYRDIINGGKIDIRCDHANGEPGAFKIPNLSEDDARDLIHLLRSFVRGERK